MSLEDSHDAAARFPKPASGGDPTALSLSPAEGFLLSRIDGQTPVSVLREIGGMPPEEVDLCLESWASQGLIEFETRKPVFRPKPAPAPRAEPAAPEVPGRVDESKIDPSLDLAPDVQRRILEFELKLGGTYFEILGVPRDTDGRGVKRAYFKLSKEYHPDRYFRKQIGTYAERLDRIFKKVLEAYELLSDPTTRGEIEKSLQATGSTVDVAPPEEPGATDGPPRPPRALTKLELLRARMPFRIPESVMAERRQKAEQLFGASRIQLEQGQFLEAAANIRLAIAFDPTNPDYKAGFGDVQAQASEMRARQMLAEADSNIDSSQLKEALRLYKEALLYKPYDPVVNHKAARVALELGELDEAQEHLDRALEQTPEVAAFHCTLGRIHRKRGNRGHAIQSLEKALELDNGDQEARELLAQLKRRGSPSAGGTR